ncbi:MAG: DHHA1 domain-containing protein [Phycisphaerae bacterium]|nr:DHHA1 domain-containing protein [Phycisphaerae bacterium]MDW8261187.1 DHHA1 domain-containing protein [Phycisphaerales bacterium]
MASRIGAERRWIVAERHPAADELAARLRTSPLIAQILLNRGLTAEDDCRNFLSPTLKLLHEPELLPGVCRAAQRIARAIASRENIVIYGDYDVDGITAVAILWHAIRRLGGNCDYYIPHRIEEGYGLNSAAVAELCQQGAKLLVSVDCGVTALESASVARQRGVDLIITDHHEFPVAASCIGPATGQRPGSAAQSQTVSPGRSWPGQVPPSLPDCHAIVHPRLPQDPAYPNPHLCGAGVAFKLAWAVGKAVSGSDRVTEDFRAFLMDALGLAALGTIADVVPLVGENRVIARFGLSTIAKSELTGVRALMASANLTGADVDSYHVGFVLAPRLNAAGRMGHARLAVELLTHASSDRAWEIAGYLESQNRRRQETERQILEAALQQASELRMDQADHHAIVLGAPGWHPGVIGIVASRIVDQFHKPAILVALQEEGVGQGSGRSISGFHLAEALAACGDCLESHGGHEMAAGLKLRTERFPEFRAAFLAHAQQVLAPEALMPSLHLDGLAELRAMDEALVSDLQRLGPFGQGNRRPVLCCRDVELAGPPRPVGRDGQHLQLYLRQNGTHRKAIAWRAGNWADRLRAGMKLDLAVEPSINEWNGQRLVEIEVRDLRPACP